MSNNQPYVGYLKYEGDLVADGCMDARKSAEALLGFDSAVRHFVGKQSLELARTQYEIPVRIEKGSWVALIPETVGGWVLAGTGVVLTTYLATAAAKMAEHDFREVGIREVFRKSLQAIQWMIRLGKHFGSLSRRTFENVRWRNGNEEVGIPNDAGVHLFVPTEMFELYRGAPPSLLGGIARIVAEERRLEITVHRETGDDSVQMVYQDRRIFCSDDDSLFPELEHGMPVNLEGLVTRGNENANSIGFQYKQHILTCYPEDGSIVRFKDCLFVRCNIKGTVTRETRPGSTDDPRPKIIFRELVPLDQGPPEPVAGLFDDGK